MISGFTTPIFRRQASDGSGYQREVKTPPKRDGEAIGIDPGYYNDFKTGYIPEHDITGRRASGWRVSK